MNKTFIPVFAAASLMALPALAAGNTSTSTNAGTDRNTNTQMSSQNPGHSAQIAQNIRQDLSKAGYTDISVTPGSFVVHAKNSKGDPTVMMISPTSMTSLTAVKTGQNGSTGSMSDNSGSDTSKQ